MGVQIHEDRWGVISQSLDVANVTDTNTTSEQDFTVPGLTTDMLVFVNKPSLNAGIAICGARVKAANTLSLTIVNATAGAVNPGAETYKIYWFKPERAATQVVL
jgi:hypothetical protein